MAYKIKLARSDTKKVWGFVKEIIKEHSDKISKCSSLRESFYVVRDYLSMDFLHTGKITNNMFNFFSTEEDAYRYYTQDLWVQLERQGYIRPEAKPIGILYWKEKSYTVENIGFILPQIRGFIYVEKEGIADRLKELSNYGWGIVAAQGQATREIRRLIKGTKKPCLIIHDYDPDGEIISNVIESGSKRTTHLDLTNDNATELMLNDEQQTFLLEEYKVPTQPLPNKWEGKWKENYRIELSAFVDIENDSGNSILDFVKAEIKRLGLPLSLEPISKT